MKLSNVYVTAHDFKTTFPSRLQSQAIEPETTSRRVSDLDAKVPIESHDGIIDIYFGSNTGTCEKYAHKIYNDSKIFGYDATVNPVDHIASNGFQKNRLALIVTSTYNGQPPDNAKKFAQYCKELEPKALSGVKVAIIGVGNSNWKSFQAFPSYIENALQSADAEIFCARGVADEEGDMQGDIHSWLNSKFWPCAFESIGLDPKAIQANSEKANRELGIVVTDSEEPSRHNLRSSDNELVTVVSSRELQSADSGRSTRHVEFRLPNSMNYEAGDHLAVYPENDPELVLRFASLIGEPNLGRAILVKADEISVESLRHLPLGIPTKVSDLLGKHVDLQAPVTASFLNAAVACATDQQQRDVLHEILVLLSNGVQGNCQQLRPVQILTTFPSVCMALDKALPTIAPMKKRYYSISSSPKNSKSDDYTTVSVTVGLVEGASAVSSAGSNLVLISPEVFRGVSSGYLRNLQPGQLAEASVVTNERFRLPQTAHTPVIMIGPGTGLAPFCGFVQELNAEAQHYRREAILFFGCRNEKDYLYRCELESAESIDLHVAFSRPTSDQRRQYVQDLMWKHRDRVWDLLEAGAYVYVCGDGRRMAKDVDKTLCQIAVAIGEVSDSDAVALFERLQKEGRYLQDVWCN